MKATIQDVNAAFEAVQKVRQCEGLTPRQMDQIDNAYAELSSMMDEFPKNTPPKP